MKRIIALCISFLMLSSLPVGALAQSSVSGNDAMVKATAPAASEIPSISTDYSGDVGKLASFNEAYQEDEWFFVLDTEPSALWEAMSYKKGEFSEDILFEIIAYKVVEDKFNLTDAETGEVIGEKTELTLWYQVDVIDGTVPDEFESGYWIMQNYLNEEDAYPQNVLILMEALEEEPAYEQTLPVTVGQYTLSVSGVLPDQTSLQANTLTDEMSDYIHSDLLGLEELSGDDKRLAYDISLLAGGNKVQPDGTATVKLEGIDTTKYTDFTVYHLPNTDIDTIQRIMDGEDLTIDYPEVIAPTVGDGYIEFVTDGFSIYYIVGGSQSDQNGNDTFYILRGTSVELTNVNNDNYSITYPDSTTAETSGASISRNNNTLTFAATENTALGEYRIQISGNRVATIYVLSPEDMFNLPDIDNDVYFTVIGDSTEIPNEPMSGGNYSWYYIKKDGEDYSFNLNQWGTNGRYQTSPEGFLNLDIIGSSDALEQNLDGQNVIGVIDRGMGNDTRPCINLTDIEWHNILMQFVTSTNVSISDGAGGTIRLTGDMVSEKLEDGSYRYKMYPYVVKLIIDGGSWQDGWHIDCAVVDTKTYAVSYEYNLPSTAIIQENSDLLKPETKFYTPGTTGVEVGVMTLGNREVTGDTSVTIYDTNTLSTSEYKFLYWNTSPDGSGTSYKPDDVLPAINSNVTLYAIWNHTQTSGIIKLQKSEVFEDSNDERKDDGLSYTFTVSFANAETGKAYPYTIYNADNTIKTQNLEIVSGDTISLLGGQYAIISNVPGGAVTISENISADFEFDVSWNIGNTTTENTTVTATVKAGNQTEIVCVNTYVPLVADLTIIKNGAQSIDKNQSFIFTVEGMGIKLDVVINGNGSVTIQDLPIGDYTVTENSGWSWRYAPTNKTRTIKLTANGENTVNFDNTRSLIYWLSGDSYNENQFTIKTE